MSRGADETARKLGDMPWKQLGVEVALLFGSTARGDDGERSDIDLAFLLGEPYDPMVRLRLISESCSRLGTDDVDVVILNEALTSQPLLASRILVEGRVLFETDPARRIDFHLRARRLAADARHLLGIADRAMRSRASHG